MSTRIRVIIADDTMIAREGWKRILETAEDIEIISEVVFATDLVKKAVELSPEIVITDLLWYGDELAGVSAITELKKVKPEIKVLAVTAYEDLIKNARHHGADMVLLKTFTRQQLIDAIHELVE